jgi:hypothetical protein
LISYLTALSGVFLPFKRLQARGIYNDRTKGRWEPILIPISDNSFKTACSVQSEGILMHENLARWLMAPLLLCVTASFGQPTGSAQMRGPISLTVEAVKRIAVDNVQVEVKLRNDSAAAIFLEESGRGDPWILHSVIVIKIMSPERSEVVGPFPDIGAQSVVRLDTGHEIRSIVNLSDPFRTAAGKTIPLPGKCVAEVRYFSSEEQWRLRMNQRSKPQIIVSDAFRIPPGAHKPGP